MVSLAHTILRGLTLSKVFKFVAFLALIALTFTQGGAANAASQFPTQLITDFTDAPGTDLGITDPAQDIIKSRFVVTNQDELKFSIWTSARPVDTSGEWQKTLGVAIDVDGDGQRDFAVQSFVQDFDYGPFSPGDYYVYDDSIKDYITCQAYVGFSSESGMFRADINILDGCFDHSSSMGIRFSAVDYLDAGETYLADYLPYPNGFIQVKANYIAGVKCTKKYLGSGISYLGKSFSCQKSGKTYKFLSKGDILAKKAKYLTDFAYYKCAYDAFGATLSGKGKTLTLSGAYLWSGLNGSQVDCVFSKAKFPSWLVEQIGMTRALDGMQKASYKVGKAIYLATWTYHPDNGLNLILRKK